MLYYKTSSSPTNLRLELQTDWNCLRFPSSRKKKKMKHKKTLTRHDGPKRRSKRARERREYNFFTNSFMIHRKKIVKLPTLLSSRIFIKGFNMFIDGEDISRPYWSWRKFGYPSEQFCDWSLWLQPDQLRLISRSNNCCHFSSCSNIPIAQFDFFLNNVLLSSHTQQLSRERERGLIVFQRKECRRWSLWFSLASKHRV